MPVQKVLLPDVKILSEMEEKLYGMINACEDIMSSSSNDIGYTKLIEMDIETDPYSPPIASKPYTLPLKHQKLVRNELEDFQKAGIIQRCLSPYTIPIIIFTRNVHQFHQCKRQKDFALIIENQMPDYLQHL